MLNHLQKITKFNQILLLQQTHNLINLNLNQAKIPVNQMNLMKIKIIQSCLVMKELNFDIFIFIFMSSNKYIEQSPEIQN